MALDLSLDHVSLRVPDYDASLAWYRHLGLDVVREWEDPTLPGLRLCHLRLGSTKLELIGGGQPEGAGGRASDVATSLAHIGVAHLCLTVPNLDDAIEALAANGVHPFDGPLDVPDLKLRLVLIHDHDGNVLEIAQTQ